MQNIDYKHIIKCSCKIMFLFILAMALSSCADNVTFVQAATMQPVGFWYGLWHGEIAAFAFIISLFDPHTTIYAIYNDGLWYNFGFVLGCSNITMMGMGNIPYLR